MMMVSTDDDILQSLTTFDEIDSVFFASASVFSSIAICRSSFSWSKSAMADRSFEISSRSNWLDLLRASNWSSSSWMWLSAARRSASLRFNRDCWSLKERSACSAINLNIHLSSSAFKTLVSKKFNVSFAAKQSPASPAIVKTSQSLDNLLTHQQM